MEASNQNLAGGANENMCAESWHSTITLSQNITVPNGTYKLTGQAFYRQDGSDDDNLPYFYANDAKQTFPLKTGSENSMSDASASFSAGKYVIDPIWVYVDNGSLTVGVKLETNTSLWCIWDNFVMTYYGDVSIVEAQNAALVKSYKEALAEAQSYQEIGMFESELEAFNTIVTNNTLDLSSATAEELTTATANLVAANVTASKNCAIYTTYTNIATAIEGKTNVDVTSYIANLGFETGTLEGWTSVDGGSQANNKNFSKMSGEHFVERWKNNAALGNGSLTHDVVCLPKGIYTITAEAQNIEQYNNNAAGMGYFLCANEEQAEIGAAGTYSTSVLLTDKQELTIKFLLDNCTGNWISCDNVTVTFIGEDFPAYTLVTGKMNADVAAAQTAADEAFLANKTIANYNTLTAAITAASASKEAYTTAATAIANAKVIQANQNFASADAATTFADAIAAIETPYNNNTLTTDAGNGASLALGSVVTGWHAAANSAAVAYLNNGFSLNAFDAALYINTWSTEGEGDGSNFKVPFYEYFAGDGNSLGENTWTGTLSGLENGLYEVSAWVRVRTMNDDTAAADATGIFMNVNGGTAIDVTEGTQIGESRFQLKEYTAEGLVKDGTLNVNFVINAENNIHWLSFKNLSYTKVRDLTEEEAAVVPTAIALYNGEDEVTETIALNPTENTVTLTPSYEPIDATEGVTWTSSDETVATVADGVVTAVSSGSATITATSTLDENVYATATVTVSYPESTVPEFVNNGATRTVYNFGPNLIKNGSFEYPNPVYGWQDGTRNALSTSNFNIQSSGAYDGSNYLQAKESKGQGDVKSIYTAWPIENGKTYVFSYQIKTNGTAVKESDLTYVGTSLSNNQNENGISKFATPNYSGKTEWTEVSYEFTNSDNYSYLVFSARWLASAQSFDNFYLCEVLSDPTTVGNVEYATAAIPTSNIGTDAFQYSQDAIDVANALVQGTATVEEVEAAYAAVTTLNAPKVGQLYNIKVATADHPKEGNAVLIGLGATSANNPTGYTLNANLAPNTNLAQAFSFTQVEGNNYKISTICQGETVYLTNGALNGSAAGWKNSQIQATTDASKAMAFKIAASLADGVFNIYNTTTNSTIACQTGGNIYTEAGNADFTLAETSQASITINTTAAGYGTTILPFAVAEIPNDVKVYTCAAVEGSVLTLAAVEALEANKPYIIEGAWDETLTGDAQGTALTYTEGLLTGVYTSTPAPVGSYVLQNNDSKVGFYQVAEGKQPTVGANRAYLEVPTEAKSRAAFFFEADDATAISTIAAMTAGEVEGIYTIGGAKVQSLQKGVNILKMKNGQTRKVIVK